jgi:4'-phosphopantetheinyl transferase
MKEESEMAVCSDVQDFQACNIPLPRVQTPADGEVHLWFLDLGELVGSLQDALGGSRRKSSEVDAHQLLFARRFYLRLLLGSYLGLPGKSVRINRKQRGKPVLDVSVHDDELHFSMAKSGDRLLIGLSTSSHIGVDLEPAGRKAQDALGVAKRYFSRAEAESLAALPPEDLDAAFLRAWACKEAVVKASGMGIANQFARFTVETDLNRPTSILEFEGEPAKDWTLALVRPESGLLGAVAVQESVTTVRAFRLLSAVAPKI